MRIDGVYCIQARLSKTRMSFKREDKRGEGSRRKRTGGETGRNTGRKKGCQVTLMGLPPSPSPADCVNLIELCA